MRAGKFISVANMKGGVGKTTTVVTLAESLIADDMSKRVLVVDLDPQASASLCLAGDDALADMIEQGTTFQAFLESRIVFKEAKHRIDPYIHQGVSLTWHQNRQLDVSLLPCGPELRSVERAIIHALTGRGYSMNAIEGQLGTIFKKDFQPLREQFDYVIFDCPPGISPFAEVAIRGSDMVLVPTIPDKISNFGLNAFCGTLWGKGVVNSLGRPPKPHVLITRMQEGTRQHRDMMERFEVEAASDDSSYHLLRTRIPQLTGFVDAMSGEGQDRYRKRYPGDLARVMGELTTEVKGIFHAH